MKLPEHLKLAIEQEARLISTDALQKASQQLSQRYREESQRQNIMQQQQRFVDNAAQRLAYIQTRMPATFGAIQYVLNELKNRYTEDFHSALDVGSGPGTALWTIAEVFPSVSEITLLEQDSHLIALGKKLTSGTSETIFKKAKWLQANVLKQETFPQADLIIASYTLGEWPQDLWEPIVEKLWKSTQQALVILEPGTMKGFDAIRKVRQKLIDLGGHMVAPCPHHKACPMPDNDWCHFSVRIERSRLHRQTKEASLGYEDEKFSYVIFSQTPTELPEARILRHPQKRSGHLSLKLCTRDNGLVDQTISRRDGELYKEARDLEWGDTLINEKF